MKALGRACFLLPNAPTSAFLTPRLFGKRTRESRVLISSSIDGHVEGVFERVARRGRRDRGDEKTEEEGEIGKREREEDEEELVDLNESDVEGEGEEGDMTRWRGRDLLVTVKKEMGEGMRKG